MIAYKCDRCGKYYDNININKSYKITDLINSCDLDLCNDCDKKLEDFVYNIGGDDRAKTTI